MILDKYKQAFLDNCLHILNVKGIHCDELIILGNTCQGLKYEDELVLITKSDDDMYMEIERKLTSMAFFYLYEGKIIQFHGEYVYLEEYINTLIKVYV